MSHVPHELAEESRDKVQQIHDLKGWPMPFRQTRGRGVFPPHGGLDQIPGGARSPRRDPRVEPGFTTEESRTRHAAQSGCNSRERDRRHFSKKAA